MLRPPVIQSPVKRSLVISALMIILLLASLAGAYWYTATHRGGVIVDEVWNSRLAPVTLGPLSVEIPEGWQPLARNTTSDQEKGLSRFAIYQEPGPQPRVLVLAIIDENQGGLLRPTLHAAVNRLVPRGPGITRLEPLIVDLGFGPLKGASYAGRTVSGGRLDFHQVAVLTPDQHRFALVYVASPLPSRPSLQGRQEQRAVELFRLMIETVRIKPEPPVAQEPQPAPVPPESPETPEPQEKQP